VRAGAFDEVEIIEEDGSPPARNFTETIIFTND